MKKKLTITNLALGNLKQRKKQYTTLIIGIVLAMIFSSGTMFFISCTKSSNDEHTRRTMGNFYGYYFACEDFVDVEQGKKDGLIESHGYAHILGYAYTDTEELNNGTPVAYLDEDAKELYHVHMIEGRYPETKGEIAIEKDAALRLGIKPVIGKKISFSMLPANYTDFLNISKEKTYTIVGIMTDKRKNYEKFIGKDRSPQFPAALVSSEEKIDIGGKEIPAVFFNPTNESLRKKILVKNEAGEFYNTEFSEYFIKGIYEKRDKVYGENGEKQTNFMYNVQNLSYDKNGDVLNSSLLSITLSVVLMLASCIGIINAFVTNLNERKKQIGMLRAVGATRRQIINIFGREAFIISIICAPIGVITSYLGVKLYAKFMGDSFIFMPNFSVLILTAVASIVCVMLASLIPLVYATKISPMQAIRNVELNRMMKKKKIKTRTSFNVSKLMAQRNINFYKSRQIGVTLILVVTIFISSFGLSLLKDSLKDSTWDSWNTADYVIRRNGYPDRTNCVNLPNIDKKINLNNISDILNNPIFKSAYGYKEAYTYIAVDEYSEYLKLLEFDIMLAHRYAASSAMHTKENMQNITSIEELYDFWFEGESEFYQKLKKNSNITQEIKETEIQGYDSVMIENNLDRFEVINGKIDIDKLESGEEIILIAYENAGFVVRWDKDDRLYSHGVQDLNKNTDGDILATAKLDLKAGDTIKLNTIYSDVLQCDWETENYVEESHLSVYDKEVKIGAIVKPFYFSDTMSNHQVFGIVTTSTGMDIITGRPHDYENLNVDYDGEITDDADLAATEYLNSIFAGSYFTSVSGYANDKESYSLLRILVISLLSIVILLFSICASIVNNSLAAKIRVSKKEIGTLRAVGASVKELTSTYIYQLISMFAWGMGIGLGGYTLIHIVLKICCKEVYTIPYIIWPALLICILLCFICSLNLYLNVKKQMKHSIVENIREL